MKLRNLLITGLLIFCVNSLLTAQESGLYKVVYEADRKGNRISGSLEELNNYVRSGNPIRVGWELGVKSDSTFYLEHWADAGFITLHKNHVFAQINSIYGQGTTHPMMETPAVFLTNGKPHGWVAVFGTTGEVKQKFERDESMVKYFKEQGLSDKEIEDQFKKQEKARYATKWAVMVKE